MSVLVIFFFNVKASSPRSKPRATTVSANITSRAAITAQLRGSVWCCTALNKDTRLCKSLCCGWHQEPLAYNYVIWRGDEGTSL